jgi:hypothetical protein
MCFVLLYFDVRWGGQKHGYPRELLRRPLAAERYLRFYPAAHLLDGDAQALGL